jgi:hypothetical protein
VFGVIAAVEQNVGMDVWDGVETINDHNFNEEFQ